ncbi:alpha-1,2-fucosyltransferase [Pseudobutyrivibrio sp.]|uniref:alpha-1,2-fucosyltransferase n=1 Tax=Pseudobutyrivibrio sp. TaxID=2014367 RepID=UPI0038699054
MIAVHLMGRIGNQLFIYAAAEAIRQKRGQNEKIVFFDNEIVERQWKNSLEDYKLFNVEYRHDYSNLHRVTRLQMAILRRFYKYIGINNISNRYKLEKIFQPLLNFLGIVSCIDGYSRFIMPFTRNVYINGYLQSENYFAESSNLIRENLTSKLQSLKTKEYVKKLMNRESVCISIKVEHNAGNPLHDVCGKEYYEQAINYILTHVNNPLFFICSDNVPYVLEHFIDANKYDYICQEKEIPVSDSLTIMSTCKHFIIGNTSFGWWAQYLSSTPEKIVIAPNRWYRDENLPVCLYNEKWHLIDVTSYIKDTQYLYK